MQMNERCDLIRAIEPCPNGVYGKSRHINTANAAAIPTGFKSKAGTDRKSERELNDALRQTFTGGRVLISPGVQSLPSEDNAKVLQRVRDFTAFNDQNVPHHDFGSFEVAGVVYCFELERAPRARNSNQSAYTGEPARVLTIMRADEY